MRKEYSWWERNQRRLTPYLFIAPFYIVFLVFFVGPAIFALILSFCKWTGIGPLEFVGIANYARMFAPINQEFRKVLVNMAVYCGVCLAILVPACLVLALALNERSVRGKNVFRALYCSPAVTSTVAISLIFIVLYQERGGLLNHVLGFVGIEPIPWLQSTQWSKVSVLGLGAWQFVGFHSIYFLAGLQGISVELHEAAMIDGANRWQGFWRITLPQLRPVLLFVSVIALIASAQTFEAPQMLTRGGPLDSSQSIVQHIYFEGLLGNLRFGYASAVGVLLFAGTFIFSWLQMRTFGIFRED